MKHKCSSVINFSRKKFIFNTSKCVISIHQINIFYSFMFFSQLNGNSDNSASIVPRVCQINTSNNEKRQNTSNEIPKGSRESSYFSNVYVNTNDFQSNKSPVSYQDFTLDFYFRQFWTDPRLAFKQRTGVETLSVGSEFIKNIWVPDTFFVNEKQSYFHIATTSNEFIRIHHSGSITRSIR